ncbi:GNAT family N-acetyltransferase [Bdellovibrio reynosensis]|uniref:GNAT family N-acetyltransferase n=1 Tax=Bdellovibrio reynosensis TaxID=2835041 RepID=A0ABY4C535_9BACT|nr:GNAT family N-acetyltransferase [Bdellovibrio reynosensis]UOF00066.1 GNAT family N-acetyltransferase [Bdellovibrio reynosensis]
MDISQLGSNKESGEELFQTCIAETFLKNQEEDVLNGFNFPKFFETKNRALTSDDAFLFAVIVDNSPAGFALWSKKDNLTATLDFIYVKKVFRGTEVSKELMSAGLLLLKKKGFEAVLLNVSKHNSSAQKYYLKHSWTNEGQHPKYPSAFLYKLKL